MKRMEKESSTERDVVQMVSQVKVVEVIADSIRKVLKQMLTECIVYKAMVQYYSKCSTLLQTDNRIPTLYQTKWWIQMSVNRDSPTDRNHCSCGVPLKQS